MPFTLPGISHLPVLALTAQNQLDETRRLSCSKPSSGLESYRSSVSSTSDSFDGYSINSTCSSIFDSKSQLAKQDFSIDCDNAVAASSPMASASRKQSIALPPIRELMAPSTASTNASITPSTRTRANSLAVSPQAPPTLTRPRSQGYLSITSQPAETLPSPPQSASYVQPSLNYGYTTTSHPGSSSPITVVYAQQRSSVTDIYQHPQQPQQIHMSHSQHPAQQHQHQQAPYIYSIPQHMHVQQGLPQTPRSQSEASMVYFQQGSAHPQYYHQAQMIQQGRPSNVPINVVTRGSQDEPPKKEIKRRTRTGCLTCRRRRIKCDERKPHCHNCEKSKIYCAGYQTVRPTKTEIKKMSKMMRVGSIIG